MKFDIPKPTYSVTTKPTKVRRIYFQCDNQPK